MIFAKTWAVSFDTAHVSSCFLLLLNNRCEGRILFHGFNAVFAAGLGLIALAHSDDLAVGGLQVELDAGIGLANHKFTLNGSLLILFQFLPIVVAIIAYKSGTRKAVFGDFAL